MKTASRNAIEAAANRLRGDIKAADTRIDELQAMIDTAKKSRAEWMAMLQDLNSDLQAKADTANG